MSDALREQVARYLDGAATARERAALEAALLDEAVARVFAEELLLRDLLRHAPPEVPPEEVLARWEAAVLGQLDADADALGWLAQAVEALGWSVRGPALSLSTAGAESARAGLSTVRYSVPRGDRPARPPWWRRVLRLRSR